MSEYQEICKSHQAIADFRGKLLGFLPLASGAGLFVLLAKKAEQIDTTHLPALGIFGCLITVGLFLHELRGIDHCWDLIRRAKDLEQQLGMTHGQFTTDFNYYETRFRLVGPAFAAWIIYSTVLLSWLYVAFAPFLS